MGRKGEIVGAWSGVVAILLFMFSWIFCFGWVMPPSPNLNAEGIKAVFESNLTGIRVGAILCMDAGALTTVFWAMIMICMLRMKGPSPLYAYTQFGTGALQVMLFVLPAEIWAAAAYRPERAAEITQFGNDLAWMIFDMPVGLTMLQMMSIGIAVLLDEGPRRVFPRWFGYYTLWSSFGYLCNHLILLFKTGPFAWDGLLGWYIGAANYCVWYAFAVPLVFKAIKAHHDEGGRAGVAA